MKYGSHGVEVRMKYEFPASFVSNIHFSVKLNVKPFGS
jgi:hypothetical protein